MRRIARLLLVTGCVASVAGESRGDSPSAVPASGGTRVVNWPPAALVPYCPPAPYCPPGTTPPGPVPPRVTPPSGVPQGTVPPNGSPTPPAPPGGASTPPAAPPAPVPNLNTSLAQASSRGTEAADTAFPAVFGDLFGGGFVPGPLPVRVIAATGQVVGQPPIFVNLATGVRTTATNILLGRPADELLAGRPAPAAPGQQPGVVTTNVLPPPGQVFAPELVARLTLIPLVNRGTFKITENDTPRPTTRAYVVYNYYDNLLRGVNGPDAARLSLHQETFGYEQAFADRRMSVGIRLPYNQFVASDSSLNSTSLGDLTVITKFVVSENRLTGDVLSAGVAVTAPTGRLTQSNTLTGDSVHPTLIQPYVGYLRTGLGGNAFLQGFSAVVVPTDSSDVTLLTNSFAVGYFVYRNPNGFLTSLVPVAELHVNTPLSHRDRNVGPTSDISFPDTVTALGGLHFTFGRATTLGFASGAPLTGPRPFSLQATATFNYRF